MIFISNTLVSYTKVSKREAGKLFGHGVLTFLPCRGNLDHHLGTFQSDLGSIGFFVLNLSCINNHLLGHRRYLYRGVCDI